MEMLGTVLIPSARYRIVWKDRVHHRYPRECVVTFLGMDEDAYHFHIGERTLLVTFSETETILSVEQVPPTTPYVVNRVLRRRNG